MKQIMTEKAPAAIGPYSQAIEAGNVVFTSGQIPVNSEGKIPEELTVQAQLCFENVKAVLEAAGTDLQHVVKTTLFIRDMSRFGEINQVYGKFFTEPYPARSCVEVSALPKGVLIEMEAVAVI